MSYDSRTNRQIMQDTDRSARQTANAARYSAAMNTIQVAQLAESNKLQKIAIKEQQKTNGYLHSLDEQVNGVSQQLRNQAQILERQNESMQQLNKVAHDINRNIADIGDKIDKQTQVIRDSTVIMAANHFADWKQSPDGKVYMAWAKQADSWLKQVAPWQQSIEHAYHRDACNYAAGVVYEHRSEFSDDLIPYKSKPERPEGLNHKPVHDNSDETGATFVGVALAFVAVIIWFAIAGWSISFHTNNLLLVLLKPLLVFGSPVLFGIIIIGVVTVMKDSIQADARAAQKRYNDIVKKYRQEVQECEDYNSALKNKYYGTIFPQRRKAIFDKAYKTFHKQPIQWSTVELGELIIQVDTILRNAKLIHPDVESLPELPKVVFKETIDLPEEAYQTQDALSKVYQQVQSR